MKWPTGALDSVAILDRQSIHPADAEPATPYLGLEHLDGDGAINCAQTIGSAGPKSNKFQFSDRHLLFGRLRPYLRKIARPAFSGVCSTDIIPILPKSGMSRDYLFYFLRTPGSVNLATSRCTGANLPRLSPKQLASFRVPLPPLAEQERIARILDAAEALRAKRRETLAQLDMLLQSTFLDVFGDPVANPMGWEVKSLGDLAVRKPNNGVFRRNPEYSESLESGLPVVWVEELFRGNRIDLSESRRLQASQTEIEKYGLLPGDLLFCRSSLKLDGIAYNNVFLGEREEALFECHLIRVSPRMDIVNPMFLNLQLRSVPMRALLKLKSKTATMTTIDQKALSSVEVVVPPIGLQSRFAVVVESIEQQKARLRNHLAELDTLFASLQSRAFRGDL
ncbi:MAG: hypothetical protein F4X81_14980 [Gammaproteobacteria bacterium]|nr:hypothetical protein [Gammaproteobacteria bacterium]MYE52762.1 hypothetical protein [Gammaproteobacteria bacterium]MYK39060.1 hypothetical protein [Gemmatimonadota bacterium]